MLHCIFIPLSFYYFTYYCDITRQQMYFIWIQKQPYLWNCLDKGCTNLWRPTAAATPNISVSLACNSLHVTFLASRILRWILDFGKFVHLWTAPNFFTCWMNSDRKILQRPCYPEHENPCGPTVFVSSLIYFIFFLLYSFIHLLLVNFLLLIFLC